jgi:hypothetical protein
MPGDWEILHRGFTGAAPLNYVCTTPLDCGHGNTTFVAMEVGTPGHGYVDILRASRYARASRSPQCPDTQILRLRRANVRLSNVDPGGPWHQFFLEQAFPGVPSFKQKLTPEEMRRKSQPKRLATLAPGNCCPVCDRDNPAAEAPWFGFSKVALDGLRCAMWKRLELPSIATLGGFGGEAASTSPVRVLLVLRRSAKRAWADDEALEASVRASPALAAAAQGAKPVVTSVDLEGLSPEEQCRLVASNHVFLAMHGSSFGNLLCSPPGSVVIEVFPPGLYLEMFGLLATSVDAFNINLLGARDAADASNMTMLRGWGAPLDAAANAARSSKSYQPLSGVLEGSLSAAAKLLAQEAAEGWPAFGSLKGAC